MKNLFCVIKEKLTEFYNWKKNEVLACILKFSLIALAFLIVILTYKLLPYILLLLLLGIIFFSESIESHFSKNKIVEQPYSLEYQYNITRNALFQVLKQKFQVLDISESNSVADITPTQYLCIQYINNIPFFKFIALKKTESDAEQDYKATKEILNQIVSQKLMSYEFENINAYSYRDLPYIYIFNVQDDTVNPNYLMLNVMVIDSDVKYNYIYALQQQDLSRERKPYNKIPIDKDF